MASASVVTATVARETATCSAHIVLALPHTRKQEVCIDPACQVFPGLLIGSKESESSLSALRKAGVTHVLQCGVELMPNHQGQFVYKQLSICDREEQDIVSVFNEAFDFINEAGIAGRAVCLPMLAESACSLRS